MPRSREVKITKDDQEGYVLPSSVKAWERHGWTAEDDGSNEPSSTGPEPAAGNQQAPAEGKTKEG
jgi:hypothetical protein